MKKIKVKIYKDTGNQGSYMNKTAQFLQKAQQGQQVDNTLAQIDEYIIDQLLDNADPDIIATEVQSKFGFDFYAALDRVEDLKGIYASKQNSENKPIELVPDYEPLTEEERPRYEYPTMNEESLAMDEDWTWGEDEQAEEPNMLEEKKKGGALSKKKFVKNTVKQLKKAAEGMEQESSNQASVTDVPVGGRNELVSNFRRGIKDLGNKYYAEQIYDNQAQFGEQVDFENPMHHLKAYSDSVANIFQTPMNSNDQVGADEVPQAKYGRRMARKAARQWDKAFGKVPAGMFGAGVPNYLGMIVPSANQAGFPYGANPYFPSGMNVSYTKEGPFFNRRKRLEINNIPFFMPQVGPTYSTDTYNVPGTVYYRDVPAGTTANKPAAESTVVTSEDEVVSTQPSASAVTQSDSPTKGQTYAEYYGDNMVDPTAANFVYNGYQFVEPPLPDEMPMRQFGGSATNVKPDMYGNLQRFIGGGDDMPAPAYNAYAENDVNTKDVTDPYFKNGGLKKYAGPEESQVTSEFKPISFNTQQEYDDYMANQKKNWELDWYKNQYNNSQGRTTQGSVYQPMSNNPFANIADSFRLFKKGPGGKNYDFMWMNQKGPMTMNGQPYEPQAGTDGTQLPFTPQMDPTKAGYRPNVTIDQSGLFGRKKSMNVDWSWYDPASNPQGASDGPTVNNLGENDYSSFRTRRGDKNYNKVISNPSRYGIPISSKETKKYGGMRTFAPGGTQMDPNANNLTNEEHPTFSVGYDINKARTLNTNALNNLKYAIGFGAKGIAEAMDQNYQDQYLAANTTSDNLYPVNQMDDRGDYSGLNQRRMNSGFTGVVKKGGYIDYKKGGVYDLTQEEIGAILAAGGEIEFI